MHTENEIDTMQTEEERFQTAVNELSLLAANGSNEPEKLSMPDRCLYYTLVDLYRKHSVGALSTEQCRQAKQDAVRQYRTDLNRIDWFNRQVQNHAKLWARIESAGTAYAKSQGRTEEADRFYESVYGFKPRALQKDSYRVCGTDCSCYVRADDTCGVCEMQNVTVSAGEKCFYAKNAETMQNDTET